MLFGDRKQLAIDVLPLAPTWERRYAPERAAWGALCLWVSGENMCRNLIAGTDTVRETISVPLAPIADWLVRSWTFLAYEERPKSFPPRSTLHETLKKWGGASPPDGVAEDDWVDAREEWWSRHFLPAGSDGAHVPNLSLVRSAESMVISWRRPRFASERAPIFLSGQGSAAIPWECGEEALAAFIASVAGWLRDAGLHALYPWVEFADPLREVRSDFFDALSAFTGRSADAMLAITETKTLEELRGRLGLGSSDDPAASVVTQILRDLPPQLSSELGREILSVDAKTRGQRTIDPAARNSVRDAANAADHPEEAGQSAARELRSLLGLNGQPVGDLDALVTDTGIQVSDSGIACGAERMLAGARSDGAALVVVNSTPRTTVQWGRRFEVARGFGRLLVGSYREKTLGAASSAYAQPWMRRFSGAFAAEFLLPTTGLQERGLNHLDAAANRTAFQAVMNDYGVGARTAAFQLWNNGLLSSPQVRDELIDQFASA